MVSLTQESLNDFLFHEKEWNFRVTTFSQHMHSAPITGTIVLKDKTSTL